MRVLCLTDFPVIAPDRWIWNYLPDRLDEVDFLWANAGDRLGGLGKLVTRYPTYYSLALRAVARLRKQQYDVVVAWESAVGVPFALARYLAKGSSPPFVLLAFNPGDLPAIANPLIRAALRNVDHLTVLVSTEATDYVRRYNVSRDKISVSPLPIYDIYQQIRDQTQRCDLPSEPYIHASGRSSRDYATLVKAVDGLPTKAIIHGRGYNFRGIQIPANVEVGDLATRDDFHKLVYGAICEVVPLQAQLRPAGSSQVVFAMMMGKPVVATANLSLIDFVDHGGTGFLVPPGDVTAMREAILYLLEHPAEAARMGNLARRRYEALHAFGQFARRTHQTLRQVVEESEKL